jgi:hypothetical protein
VGFCQIANILYAVGAIEKLERKRDAESPRIAGLLRFGGRVQKTHHHR